jgi:hypothetical protein
MVAVAWTLGEVPAEGATVAIAAAVIRNIIMVPNALAPKW